MANYASLKAAIQQVVKTNGNNEITGALLQQSLLAMITSLGAGYQCVGIATPSTNPGTPDQNVFYIASTDGTYVNFGGLVLENGEIAILKYNGAWSKDSTGVASLEKVNQLGQYADKPEWVRIVTDVNDRILYGVKTDGKFYFGDGCPPQVQEYVLLHKAEILLALNEKVDKENGKSLINSDFSESQTAIGNSEYLQITEDTDGKVLEGIKSAGRKVVNIPVENPVCTEEYIINPEWSEVVVDTEDRIVKGMKKDGTQYNFKQKSTTIDEIKNNLNYLNYYQHIYPHGAIVSFIDDDTGENAPEIWGRIISATGIRLGFACVAGFMSGEVPVPSGMEMLTPMTIAQLRAFYESGNEVYSHSWTHPSFKETNDLDVIDEQCRKSRDWLSENGFTRNCDIIVYPGGMGVEDTTKQAVVRRNFKYGVDTYKTYDLDGLGHGINPEPFINDLAIIRCNGDTLTLAELKGRVDVARQHNRLLVVMNHAYELNEDKENQIAKLISFIQYIQGTGTPILPLQEAIHTIYGWH